jgi:hypothetical protein
MAAFAVLAPPSSPQLSLLSSSIIRNFPKHFEIAQGQYVVAATSMTAEQVAKQIGIDGVVGQFVVFSIAGTFGYHRKDLWEWITLNSG